MPTGNKKFPTKVMGLGGPIDILRLPMLEKTNQGEEVAGRWLEAERIIHVWAGQSPREQWRTLYHELVHAALTDSGMTHLLTNESEEALADLIGLARTIEVGL